MNIFGYLADRKELIEGVIHTLYRDWKTDTDYRHTLNSLIHPYCHVKFSGGEENVFDLRRDEDLDLLADYYYEFYLGSVECR